MTGEHVDQEWAELATLSAAPRFGRMLERCRTVAALDDHARIDALSAMVRAEYQLADAELHPFTLSRLRAWIAINESDHELAINLARGYDTVFQSMPCAMAMRRSSIAQGVARVDLTAEEVATLFELIPSIVQQVPRVRVDSLTSRPHAAAMETRSKPLWRFW
ncbi:MAG: hypothetical protein O3B31_03260 [Chloroflexi bacterium]|nr:hypothetical protein [Chloroflexota bacterium]